MKQISFLVSESQVDHDTPFFRYEIKVTFFRRIKSGVLAIAFFIAFAVGSFVFELFNKLVRGVDEIAALMWVASDEFWRNGAMIDLSLNPIGISMTGNGKPTGCEFTIDFWRDFG